MLVSSAWVTSVVIVSSAAMVTSSSCCLDSMMALDTKPRLCVLEEVVEVVRVRCRGETSLCFKYPHNAELLRGSGHVSLSVRTWWCSNGGRGRGIMWMDGPGWDFGLDGIKWQIVMTIHWLAFGTLVYLGWYGYGTLMWSIKVCREQSAWSSLTTRTCGSSAGQQNPLDF